MSCGVHSKIHLLRLTKHSRGIAGQKNVHLSQQQDSFLHNLHAGCVLCNLVQLTIERIPIETGHLATNANFGLVIPSCFYCS